MELKTLFAKLRDINIMSLKSVKKSEILKLKLNQFYPKPKQINLLFNTTDTTYLDWVDFDYAESLCQSNGTISIVLDVIGVVINSIALVIVLTIATITIRKLRTLSNMNNLLKYIFYISVFGCLIVLCGTIWIYMSCVIYELSYSSLIASYITTFGYFIYIDCILATLLVRLYITFKNSVYKMSKYTKNTFIAVSTIICVLSIAILSIHACIFWLITIDIDTMIGALYFGWFLFLIKSFLYFVCAVTAVYIFCNNLLTLTLQQTHLSTKNVLTLPNLNSCQQKMINMASKYVGLFLIAISSSIISVICNCLTTLQILPAQITAIIFGIDCSVNIICICLQFSFATNYYLKWCKCVDVCCTRFMTRNMIKYISEIRINKNGYDGCPTTES